MRTAAALLTAVFAGPLLSALAACSGANADDADTSGAAVTANELALAKASVSLLAGDQAHCNFCHTAGRSDIKRWGSTMLAVAQECFAANSTPAQQVACLSDDKTDPKASYSATRLGLLAAGGALLQPLFQQADPTGARLKAFKSAAMPIGTKHPAFTADEFTTLRSWVFQGMPGFNDVLGGPPEPDTCVPSVSPALASHVADMKTSGWGARLTDAATPMFGCAPGDGAGATGGAFSCLASLPDLTSQLGQSGVKQTMRQLRTMPHTSYWVRSSADGRFVGFGQFTAAGIIDLTTPEGSAPIAVDARYDPSFFPNNDGVSFAGTGLDSDTAGPIRACKQSALTTVAASADKKLTLTETGCSAIVDSVYQSVGAALDGTSFWMSSGSHVNDDGGNQITHPLDGFDTDSKTVLIPMVSDGVGFQPQQPVTLPTPLEGDQMLSPSSQLLVTRFGSKSGHRGYHIRKLTTSLSSGTPALGDSSIVGTICGGGAKPMVSFDERFVVTHQYTDPAENTGLPENSSNVVLTDLVTGDVVRLTKMGANQYALYPHFRADGWLYFLIRDMNPGGKDVLVATDAAVQREKP
jgi:hypothetical protein